MRPTRPRELALACALALILAACSRTDRTKTEDTTPPAGAAADATNTGSAPGAAEADATAAGANAAAAAPASASGAASGAAGPAPAGPPLPAKARAEIDKALDAYEILHEKLAADTTDGVKETAQTLAGAARAAAAAGSQGPTKARLTALASTADALKNDGGSDIAKARDGFAEVSRNVVALLSQEPSLTEGRYVFICPMTNGYQKWVQKANAITNPYMGSRMLECGAASEWKE